MYISVLRVCIDIGINYIDIDLLIEIDVKLYKCFLEVLFLNIV